MKSMIRAGIFLSGIYFMSPANAGGEHMLGWGLAPETNFYGGGSLGVINQSGFDDGSTGAGKLFAGMRYRSVGAEIGYLKGGDAEKAGNGRIAPTIKGDISGVYASALGYLPVTQRAELIGKLGVVHWSADYKEDYDSTQEDSGYQDKYSDDSGFSPMVGVGAQYKLYQNIQLRGEWEHIFSTGEDNYESDADLLTVGLSMSTY